MMKSKKLWALLLALAVVLSLAACGGKDGNADGSASAVPPEDQTAGDAGSGQADAESDLA